MDEIEDNNERRPSKSQRKREMTALQDIGAELVALNAERLAQMELPEFLLNAVRDAQRITDFEGRRRQMQYIGKLMREVDAAPIRAQLDAWRNVAGAHAAQLHQAEQWRERLLNDDDNAGFAAFADAHPRSDLQRLRTLITSVRRDTAKNPAHTPKNYRELFRFIRAVLEEEA